MMKSRANEAQTRALRGQAAIQEAARLLRQMRFWSNRGAYAEGNEVAVVVDPRWNDDNQTIRVLITCSAFGHRSVDWDGLPVLVEPEGGEGAGWMAFLNARGQAVIPNLPAGNYRPSMFPRYGRSGQPVALLRPTAGLAALGAVSSPATRWNREQAQPPAPGVYDSVDDRVRATRTRGGSPVATCHVYNSVDDRVRATLRGTQGGKTIVAFETNDEALAGATVRFAFVQASGKIEQRAEVELTPVEGEERLWEGRWENAGGFHEPCELVFDVVPKGD